MSNTKKWKRDVVAMAQDAGLAVVRVEHHRSGHLRVFVAKDGKHVSFTSCRVEGERRQRFNQRAQIRRLAKSLAAPRGDNQ